MIAKSIKFLLLVVIFFSVLEVCARLDDWLKWGASPFQNYSRDLLIKVDQYGFRNRPNAQFEKWKINQYGFRGPGYDLIKQTGVVRIMILGASETFGLYENPDMEYPAQLQRILDKDYPGKFQIINAAVPGISPPRLLHLYQEWLRKFKADVIYYYPSPSIYLLAHPPGPVIPGYEPKAIDQPFQLRISGKIRIILKRFIPDRIQAAMKKYLISIAISSIPADSLFHKPPHGRLELFQAQLSQLIDEILANGTEVVVITHANRISNPISDEEWRVLTGWRKLYPHVVETCFLDMEKAGNEIIRHVAMQFGLQIVDADNKIPKTAEYFADHVHFTDEGAAFMAELLANHILLNAE